jgi:acyl dehydratase
MDRKDYGVASLSRFVGSEVGLSDWVTIDQDRVDRFADCTDDHQWIHVEPARARRESPLGSTVAHGFLTLALTAHFTYQSGVIPPDASAALNYGVDKVRFLVPVKVGSRVRDRITLLEASARGPGRLLIKTLHTLEIEGEDRPALVAETLAMLLFTPPGPER